MITDAPSAYTFKDIEIFKNEFEKLTYADKLNWWEKKNFTHTRTFLNVNNEVIISIEPSNRGECEILNKFKLNQLLNTQYNFHQTIEKLLSGYAKSLNPKLFNHELQKINEYDKALYVKSKKYLQPEFNRPPGQIKIYPGWVFGKKIRDNYFLRREEPDWSLAISNNNIEDFARAIHDVEVKKFLDDKIRELRKGNNQSPESQSAQKSSNISQPAKPCPPSFTINPQYAPYLND